MRDATLYAWLWHGVIYFLDRSFLSPLAFRVQHPCDVGLVAIDSTRKRGAAPPALFVAQTQQAQSPPFVFVHRLNCPLPDFDEE